MVTWVHYGDICTQFIAYFKSIIIIISRIILPEFG